MEKTERRKILDDGDGAYGAYPRKRRHVDLSRDREPRSWSLILPLEIMSLIANGADARGRPFLDPRYRFVLSSVSCAWRAVVSSPSTADAARLRQKGPPGDAWVFGRGASLSLVVERARVDGATPQAASASYGVPRDPHRGEVAAWLATASVGHIMAGFIDTVERLSPTATDWFPHVRAMYGPCGKPRSSVRAIARCNFAMLACSLKRADVVDAFMEWYGVRDLDALHRCVSIAAARDDVGTLATIVCHVTRDRMGHDACNCEPTMSSLLKTAFASAASHGSLCVMRRLVDWTRWDERTKPWLVRTDDADVSTAVAAARAGC